jgi:ABC-type cobalamin transport system permease subunit
MATSKYSNKVTRPYLIELMAAMLTYGVLLAISLFILVPAPRDAAWRTPVALLPMLGALGVLAAVVRAYRRMDELDRRLLLEGIGISFAGTALLTFAYGFLETVGFPRLSWFFVWGIMGALWLGAALVNKWRYR